jgi:molecular chaperone GrpE
MTKSSAPSRSPAPVEDPDSLSIEIDPTLIEEALASVARAGRAPARPGEDAGDEVSLRLDPPAPPADVGDERRRLQVRVTEQTALIQRLERDLARATESRAELDRALRDVRVALRDQTGDFERFRTRTKKDLDEAERRGEDLVLRPLADVYDNVERAWSHAIADPSQLLSGLQIIVEQFKRLMARMGFERIEADRGMLFDPEVHEAVLHVQDDGVLPGTIVHEVHAGFRLRGRLFRPARVTVSAPPPGSGD